MKWDNCHHNLFIYMLDVNNYNAFTFIKYKINMLGQSSAGPGPEAGQIPCVLLLLFLHKKIILSVYKFILTYICLSICVMLPWV